MSPTTSAPIKTKRDTLCAAYAELEAMELLWQSDSIPQHPDLPEIRALMMRNIAEHKDLLRHYGFHQGMLPRKTERA